MLVILVEQILDPRGVQRSPHVFSRVCYDAVSGLRILGIRFPVGDALQDVTSQLASFFHDEIMLLFPYDLGQGEIVTEGCLGPGFHGDAEAGAARLSAVDGNDKDTFSSSFIHWV